VYEIQAGVRRTDEEAGGAVLSFVAVAMDGTPRILVSLSTLAIFELPLPSPLRVAESQTGCALMF
jgi:hypothetical protein